MSRKFLFKVIVFLGLAIPILALAAVEYTSRPLFCAGCHEMRPAYEAWNNSGHRGVNCLRCHSDPGLGGLARTKLKGLKEVYLHFTGNYRLPITITTETPRFTARCLRCHVTIWGGERGSHNIRHRNLGLNCTRCHKGLVHDPALNKVPPGRGVCVDCHGTENPSEQG